jgi:D-alanyl-D-alanine carboxypeptidase
MVALQTQALRRLRGAGVAANPRLRLCHVAAALLVGLLGWVPAAHAQIGSDRYSSIVVEASTGSIVSAVNPDELRHPASLTKMMTLYMVFEALRDRRIGLNQLVPVTAHASAMSPTKLGLMPGTRISVEEAILGLVTKSANDAAAALGEMLGGDETRFAQMMTLRARALGMSRTVFRNASGLPDFEQVSTARDLSLLGRRLVQDFPVEYRYFSVPQFRWHGRVIFNHDQLLERYPGTDGIKTGYVEASGYNLVTSTVRGNLRLVGVVMGAARAAERDLHMIALLDQAYEKLDIPVAPRVAPDRGFQARVPQIIGQAQAAVLPMTRPRPAPPRWTVQVGAFPSEGAARRAAIAARRVADAGEVRVEPASPRGRTNWRAQVTGLIQSDAVETCAILAKRKTACMIIRPDTGQVANR